MSGEEEIHKGTNSRWWEFYAVRYAMGTAVGAGIVYFLCKSNKEINEQVLGGVLTINAFTTDQLIILSICGLVFCYIASAPILVFHAGRMFLEPKYPEWSLENIWEYVKTKLLERVIYILLVTSFAYKVYVETSHLDNKLLYAMVSFLVASTIVAQYVCAYKTISKSDEVYSFYKCLSEKRTKEKTDIVESYRHMREHGNSFGILFCEIILGLTLYVFGNLSSAGAIDPLSTSLSRYLLVIFFWILPATIIWITANLLERKFSEYVKK